MAGGMERTNLQRTIQTPETQPEEGQTRLCLRYSCSARILGHRCPPWWHHSAGGCSHCTQRPIKLSKYMVRCPDHQREVDASRCSQALTSSHSLIRKVKQTAPGPAPSCSSCPVGVSLEQFLLQTAAQGW